MLSLNHNSLDYPVELLVFPNCKALNCYASDTEMTTPERGRIDCDAYPLDEYS